LDFGPNQQIAELPLAVQLHAPAQSPGLCRGNRNAGIHGGLVARGRFGSHQLPDQVEQRRLLATSPGQQGAHGDGKIGSIGHP
jgi:hypothetical protein